MTGNTGSVTLDDVTIASNRVTDGNNGGFDISNNPASVRIRRANVLNNEVFKGASGFASRGGGNFRNNTSVVMTDSVVSGNLSDYQIAALGIDASFNAADRATGLPVAVLPPITNSITFDRVTISGNITSGAANSGSGYAMIYTSSPGANTILNSTIAGNVVTNGNDAGFTFQSFNPSSQVNASRVVFRNSTIARNTSIGSEVFGFGSYNAAAQSGDNPFNGSITIESSVLGARQAAPTAGYLIYAATPSAGLTLSNNLFETNGHPYTSQCGQNGNLCNVDAKLEPLSPNGGPTKTLRLLAGSPAINSGSNSTNQLTDQRGAARLQGPAVDMGAYETPAGSAVACNLDMDGDSLLSPTKEGVVLVRAMIGFVGNNVTAGTGLAASWATIRASLNANCGTNFQ